MELKVIAPRLMRTEAVLVVRYSRYQKSSSLAYRIQRFPRANIPNNRMYIVYMDRLEVCNELEHVYLGNLGECIVFLWAEQIRESTCKHGNIEKEAFVQVRYCRY